MKPVKVKPCPFDGSDEVEVVDTTQYKRWFAVKCEVCQCLGPECRSEEEAIKEWNKRHE
jgi:Lar family restriction alleviation protein